MRKIWITVLLIMGGCCTPTQWPPRYFIGVPSASAAPAKGTVWLDHHSKRAEDGNTYTISFFAVTNNSSIDPDSPYFSDIGSNRWPNKRVHIDLSLDGGQTWPRRIGYGINVDPSRVGGEFIWSPPLDYALMTTNARLRAVLLDGSPLPRHNPPMPYEIPAGEDLKSATFVIAAMHVYSPAPGDICFASTPAVLRWRQSGGGGVIRVYWISPDTVTNWPNQHLATLSNCVDMAIQERQVTMPPHPISQIKLVLLSDSDPNLIGYSPVFTVDP